MHYIPFKRPHAKECLAHKYFQSNKEFAILSHNLSIPDTAFNHESGFTSLERFIEEIYKEGNADLYEISSKYFNKNNYSII